MSNLDALKNLASVICGVPVEEIPGTNLASVIQFIADNYPAKKK